MRRTLNGTNDMRVKIAIVRQGTQRFEVTTRLDEKLTILRVPYVQR